jgi:hypothetical protein
MQNPRSADRQSHSQVSLPKAQALHEDQVLRTRPRSPGIASTLVGSPPKHGLTHGEARGPTEVQRATQFDVIRPKPPLSATPDLGVTVFKYLV